MVSQIIRAPNPCGFPIAKVSGDNTVISYDPLANQFVIDLSKLDLTSKTLDVLVCTMRGDEERWASMEVDISASLDVQMTLAQKKWEQAIEQGDPLSEVRKIIQDKYKEILLAYAAVYQAKSNEIKARLLKPPLSQVLPEYAALISIDTKKCPKDIHFMPVHSDDEKKRGDKEVVGFWAHRFVVEAASPHLKAAIKQGIISIDKVSERALKIFVQYLYTNTLGKCSDSALEELYQMGVHFEMKHLMECSREGHAHMQMESLNPNAVPNPEEFGEILSTCDSLKKIEQKYGTYLNLFRQNKGILDKL